MNTIAPQLTTHGAGVRAQPCLVWRFDAPQRCIASAPVGGGSGTARWVINAQVDTDYRRTDLDAHIAAIAADCDCAGRGLGLLTAARVGAWQRGADEGAVADATVGVSWPIWAAAPPVPATGATRPGTINIVVQVPVCLSAAALVGAVITVTEAKTQALLEAGVPGTGTASDAVCILCPQQGPAEAFAGPRAPWGARIARAVHSAVRAGLEAKP